MWNDNLTLGEIFEREWPEKDLRVWYDPEEDMIFLFSKLLVVTKVDQELKTITYKSVSPEDYGYVKLGRYW